MKNLILAVCIAVLLSGCASSVKSFFDRAVVEDDVDGAVGTLSVTAARRMALVRLEEPNRGRFCAEPPPDVSENIVSTLDAQLKAKIAKLQSDAELGLKDSLTVQAVALTERTALLDVYRTGTYALCQYHLNGAIKDNELKSSFDALTTKVLEELGKNQINQ